MANEKEADFHHDSDPQETTEWVQAFQSVIDHAGSSRGRYLLSRLIHTAAGSGVGLPALTTDYINSIPVEMQARNPDDIQVTEQLRNIIRWNALVMVLKATHYAAELGGHLASYASISVLYEVGFNHFFHAESKSHGGDLVFFQGHSSPGIYSRAFLEGTLSEERISAFRQEIDKSGVSSYPHPWLMPDFWQFPTVSMGLGPIQSIYQARFLKYLHYRGLVETEKRKVWCYCGDGEMDEPESLGAISLAVRERLDNLIFVINCNLQRLDGPVRGNGKIIQELESVFRGAGWHVIKVIWGSGWDALLAADHDGLLVRRMNEVVDGDYQKYKARDGAFVREHFFGAYPELLERVKHLSDDDIWNLTRGGLDPDKVYAAYAQAVKHQGQPVVILAKTIKGFGLGTAGESQNVAHNTKKMSTEQLLRVRDRLNLPLNDKQVEDLTFYKPDPDSPEMQLLKARRGALGGAFPKRREDADETLPIPPLSSLDVVLKGSGERSISSTMAFVRIITHLLKDKNIGKRIVPIVADESRTFGMEGLFRQVGIYAFQGQLYNPVDREQVMYYRESQDGQILQEGINEAGAMCSWIAAGTAYSNSNIMMIPFYVYYSMFGFQRIGDLAWAAGDQGAHGFLIGGTAGRTTLAGEGLQHQDGHSHVLAQTIPNCVSYDPTFGYELAVIIQNGLERMYVQKDKVFYYITVMNENYQHPAMPEGIESGIVRGLYLLQEEKSADVQLMGSGSILRECIEAAKLLKEHFGVTANIWSATSINELFREAWDVERDNRLHPNDKQKTPYVTDCFQDHAGPVIAATDYIRSYPEQLRAYIPNTYVTLGTDGFGRSDRRTALREFFEVNAGMIAYTALHTLVGEGSMDKSKLKKALKIFNIQADKANPLSV